MRSLSFPKPLINRLGYAVNTAGAASLAAPSGLTATQITVGQVDLAWTDNSTGEDGFKIERSPDGSSWAEIDTVGAGITAYSDITVALESTYYYRVRAYQGVLNSSYSNTDSLTVVLVFLFRDKYTNGPLAQPRIAEPGPGTFTNVQLKGSMAISGAELVITGQVSAGAHTNLGLYSSAAIARGIGKAIFAKIDNTSGIGALGTGVVFKATQNSIDIAVGDGGRYGIIWAANGFGHLTGTVAAQVYENITINTEYHVCMILRTSGVFVLIKGGVWADWRFLAVCNTGTDATLYPVMSWALQNGIFDDWCGIDLVANGYTDWNDDYAGISLRISGSVSAGQTFAHASDCIIQWQQDTLPNAGQLTRISFRKQDSNNYLYVEITSAGAMSIWKREAGVNTSLVSGGTIVAGGNPSIQLSANNIRAIGGTGVYGAEAQNTFLQTEDAGAVEQLGTGGTISNLRIFTQDISGALLTALNAVDNYSL